MADYQPQGGSVLRFEADATAPAHHCRVWEKTSLKARTTRATATLESL